MTANHSDRLETWKEIAAYLGRDLRTVMRWEKERSLPIRRFPGGGRAAVYAYRSEIDNWLNNSPGALAGETNGEIPGSQNPRTRVPASDVRPASGAHGVVPMTIPTDRRRNDSARASQEKTRGWRSMSVAAVAVAAILLLALVAMKGRSSADERAAIPAGINHKIKISLINDEPEVVPGPFQQMLTVDSSRYASVEAPNLQNVEFFDGHGRILKSWLESGNSNVASRTIYWIQLPEGIPASTVLNIYMGFADQKQNLFNTATTGEAPGLSATYGLYDDGNAMFPHYANFAGTEIPAGWYKGTTPGGHGELRTDNGVFLAHSGRGGGSVFIGSDWSLGNKIAEMDLLSQKTRADRRCFLFAARTQPASIGPRTRWAIRT